MIRAGTARRSDAVSTNTKKNNVKQTLPITIRNGKRSSHRSLGIHASSPNMRSSRSAQGSTRFLTVSPPFKHTPVNICHSIQKNHRNSVDTLLFLGYNSFVLIQQHMLQ